MMRSALLSLPLLALVAGCDLAPAYKQPHPATPSQWPTGEAYPAATDQPAGLPWRTMIADTHMRAVIERALAANQNLAATVANVAAARAQYRVQRSAQLPTLTGDAGATLARGITQSQTDTSSYNVNAGISSFEIDLFGRLKNLTRQAFEQYLATEAGMRSARITLIAETANAYLTLASDRDLLTIARDTVASGNRSLELTRTLFNAGLAAASDVSNAETIVAQAQSDAAQYTTYVAQDRNALELLVGGPVQDEDLPQSLATLDPAIAITPAGLSSTVLLQRPDVLQAEHQLKGANASIGAARAAFFPTITLTSALGVASTALSSLFTGGALSFTAAPQASLPILGGTNRGNLAYAKAERDYYLATYRYTVQTAFREVADGLARRGTIDRQRAAQARLVAASATSYRLADAQYRVGTDTYLNALTAQRTLYSARQSQVATVLTDLQNRISLYEYIGSDAGR
ncbi:efflux transporter outer membrane subunit [Sphingomonas nostoxanthinifaciens]|uniref:efflux transporter outer membrane subunit n=1 Tax=Sphingomonas nostoxanthinifaciens TaxID=2872652 RepID=UPI001CC1E89D|nr:efflux transporter outer membrane subunit [Sphingomonas nostoxanthinifaciens]UAK25070.1 efflux transporter outer membrane subunit [Sphingomonas nostoxanthinifaciens]